MSNAFYLKRQDFFLGKLLKFGETGKIKLLRLARKNSGKWVRPVHEVWQAEGQSKTLFSPLLHSPAPNVAQFLKKLNYYTTLNAQFLNKKGIKSSWWQIVLYPTGKFIYNYFIKLGFLDRTHGFLQAIFMSLHSFLTRGKLWLLPMNQTSDSKVGSGFRPTGAKKGVAGSVCGASQNSKND